MSGSRPSSRARDEGFAAGLKQRWQLDLTLPLGHAGDAVWSGQVVPLLETLNAQLRDLVLYQGRLTLERSGIRYRDTFWQLVDGRRLILIGGDLKDLKYLLEAFMCHLGAEAGSLLVNLKSGACVDWPAFAQSCGEDDTDPGESWLSTVLSLWREGQSAPLPFSPGIASEYVTAADKDPDGDAAALLNRAYTGKWETYNHVGEDYSEAQCLCFEGDSPASP